LGGHMQAAKAQNAEDSEAAVHLLELEREATAKRSLYEHLLRRYEEIAGQQGILEPGVRILSAAEVPVGPHTPSPIVATAVGFTVSIVVACLLALVLEQSDKTLRSARQVERRLGVSCLGLIPGIRRRRRRAVHDCLVESPASAYAQSLRTLAVLITAHQRGPAVVLVSSALPREGKSTLAAALAISVFQTTGKRVALVDFDLWRPSLAGEFGLKPAAGVSDFLVDGDWRAFKDQDCTLQSSGGIDILPAGLCPTEGLQHLTDRTARLLFEDLRGRYDLVVLDSPPLLGVNDGRILAMFADSVLIAVRWGSTSRMAALGALKSLHAVSAKVLGVVLTRVDSRKQALYGEGDSLQYQREFQRYYVG
ncbi:MAG: AAA family ATPase, partial [Bacteroidota bacterium]